MEFHLNWLTSRALIVKLYLTVTCYLIQPNSMANLDISRIMIVGACVRAASESAALAGYKVEAVDLFSDTDTQKVANCTKLVNYPYDIPGIVKQLHPDAVCITGALENYPDVLAEIRSSSRLLASPEQTISEIRSPQKLNQLLQTHQFEYPLLAETDVPQTGSWIAKPFHSAAGQHIRQMNSTTSCPEDSYLQQFIDGTPMSASFLLQPSHATLLGTTELLENSNEPNFQFLGAVTKTLPHHHQAELIRFGHLLANPELVGLTGLIGVDFILTPDDHLVFLEVNPRYTATMELFESCWKHPLMHYHIAAFQDPHVHPLKTAANLVAGKRIIYARRAWDVSKVWLEHVAQIALASNLRLADIPSATDTITAGHPILTIAGKNTNAISMQQTLENVAEQIQDSTTA